MKDAYEVLRTKEREMENLRIEIEALRIAAPLLSDDGDDKGAAVVSTRWVAPTRSFQVPQAANSDPQLEHAPEWKERTAGSRNQSHPFFGRSSIPPRSARLPRPAMAR